MSVTAIGDVGNTLVELLKSELAGTVTLAGPLDPDEIALLSPAEAEDNGMRLTVFLYSVTPTVELRNEPPVEISPVRQRRAPLSLDLYYLVTTFSPPTIPDPTQRTQDAHLLLGMAMRVFFDHGLLTGTVLQGDLPPDTELRLTLQPITVEDMTRLWSVFPDHPYRPSVSYLVTPARVDSTDEETLQRVISKRTDLDRMVPHPVGTGEGG